MLFRLDIGTTEGRCGTGGGFGSPCALIAARLDDDPLSLTDEGGVEVPLAEFRVEDDLAVGTVPLDSLEESDVRKLALERLRSSLKNGIAVFCDLVDLHFSYGHDVGSPDAGTRFLNGGQGYSRSLAGL
jgi:hypothetical protein